MHYYLRWIIWQLKKKRVQIGLIVGGFIALVGVIGLIVANQADLLTPRSSYENCVLAGMDRGREYFKAVCEANQDCSGQEFSEVEMDGFLQYAESVREECQRLYPE